MNIIWLKDLEEGSVDAVIIASISTKQEVDNAIIEMKEQTKDDYQWDDLINCLPKDCKLYDKWNYNDEIYY